MAVRGMITGRAGCPSGMRAEELKGWRKEAKREKDTVGRRWEMVVHIAQLMFRDGTVPVEIAWTKMALVLKGEGDYRDIGLLEVLWKVYAVVINCRLKRSVVIHNSLHGFRTGRGTGAIEAKLAQQLAGITHEPIFRVFLYVRKAYDLLDWERCLEIMRGYGLGTNLDRLLEKYWRRQRIYLQ